MKPPYAIGSVPSLSGHAIAYRWRSLPRVRRHRASKPQGSFERVLPWQITMDQLIFASLSHTHYWYEVGMLKVPKKKKTFGARRYSSIVVAVIDTVESRFDFHRLVNVIWGIGVGPRLFVKNTINITRAEERGIPWLSSQDHTGHFLAGFREQNTTVATCVFR